MPRKNLTTRFCESATVAVRTDFQDELVRGLSLRVAPGGAKTWNVVYAREGDSRKRRVKLGRFPALSLERARAKALKLAAAIAEGDDPAGTRRASRAAETVEQLGALYIEKYAKRQKRTWAEDQRILKRDVYPVIGEIKAGAVKRRDVLDIIEAKAEAGHLAQSTHVLAAIRKFFNWAVDSDYLASSPAAGIRPRAKAVSRDRVLNDDELRAIWIALPEAPIANSTRDVIRLLFLTGSRSGEVCGMRRSEIDLDARRWTIPGGRTKNGRTHVVPLSDAAAAIVAPALNAADDEPEAPLFTRVGEPIESNAIAKAARLRLQIAGAPRWTPHDIRRTVATGMAGLGVSPHIVEAALNHISGFRAGVAGVYNRALYEPEKRRALDVWAEHVEAVVAGRAGIVVPLRADAV